MELKKANLFGVTYSLVDYAQATAQIIEMAKQRKSFGVSALAVHGLMECVGKPHIKKAVDQIDLVVPDGMPVVWAMNSLRNAALKDRVFGPDLTLHVLKKAQVGGLKVYLYGSTSETLAKMQTFLNDRFPGLEICGIHVDRFRDATPEEVEEDVTKINASGANIVLVGRGCPRQELWVAQHKGRVNAVMMAIGAAFDYYAGNIERAPRWMQRNGLEWLYRLIQEPNRLWKRYLLTNSHFIYLFLTEKIGLRKSINYTPSVR